MTLFTIERGTDGSLITRQSGDDGFTIRETLDTALAAGRAYLEAEPLDTPAADKSPGEPSATGILAIDAPLAPLPKIQAAIAEEVALEIEAADPANLNTIKSEKPPTQDPGPGLYWREQESICGEPLWIKTPLP